MAKNCNVKARWLVHSYNYTVETQVLLPVNNYTDETQGLSVLHQNYAAEGQLALYPVKMYY